MGKHVFAILCFFSMGFVVISCLKNDDEVFSLSASERMTNYLENARSVLLSSEHGWLMEIYPEGSQGYGGYAFTFEFTEDSVRVRSELFQDNSGSDVAASLWSLTNDNGPVFTCDTYNEIYHFFSTPWEDYSGSGYVAYEGDTEFVIMSVTEDEICMKGARTGNIMYMRRLSEDPVEYLERLGLMTAKFIINGLEVDLGSGSGVTAIIDNESRQIEFLYSDTTVVNAEIFVITYDTVDVAFAYTPEGLRLYEEVMVGDKPYYSLDYDETSLIVTAKSREGIEQEILNCILPENYLYYDQIPEGDYVFRFGTGGRYRCNVTLTRSGDGNSFMLSGIHDRFDIKLDYVRATGSLLMTAQELDVNPPYRDGYVMWWCPLSSEAGDGNRYFTWSTSVGALLTWNGVDAESPTFRFSDNGNWGSYDVSAFFLAIFSGTKPSVDGYERLLSNYMDPEWNIAGQSSQEKDDPYDTSEEPEKITVATSTVEKLYSLAKQ